MADPLIGKHLGHFQIDALLAEGGMGLIYRATHAVIGKQAAVKVLSEKYSSDKNMIKRLHREARAVNRIGHPNIIDIFDFGQTEDGREYFVMEYVPGENLAELVVKRGRLPWTVVRPVMAQTLDALATIHDLGFIHRDIKPENILVVEQDNGKIWVKLLDFGIVRSVNLGPDGERLTRAGSVMGTPEYVAPEQIRGRETDGRVDLYAMGIVLFEMVMGKRPYESDKMISLLMMHLRDPVPPMDGIPAELGIPAFVPEVVQHAMAKKPEERYQSAREFAGALGIDFASSGTPSGIHPPLTLAQQEAIERQLNQNLPPYQDTGTTGSVSYPSVTAPGAVLGSQTGDQRPQAVTPPRGIPWKTVAPLMVLLAALSAIGAYFAFRPDRGATVVAASDGGQTDGRASASGEVNLPALYEKVRRVLRQGAQNPRADVRRVCVKGIGELKDDEAAPFLYAMLRDDPDRSVQAATAMAISSVGGDKAADELLRARNRTDQVTRVWIDEALMRLGDERGRQGLLDALGSKQKDVRFQAALALGEAGDRAALPVLTELARQGAALNTQTVMALLGTLSRLGHETSYKALKKALGSGDRVARLGAAEAMARLGDEDAVRTLTQMLRGPEGSGERLVAAQILASLGNYSGINLLISKLNSEDEQIRRLAAEGLGSVSDKVALAPLAKALESSSWTVKAATAEALARILALMPSSLLRGSQDWLRTALANRDWSVRHTAVGISSEMDPELAVSLLGWALQDEDSRVRRAAVESLDQLRSPKAVALLTHALHDASPEVRGGAAQALGRAVAKDDNREVRQALHEAVRDSSPTAGVMAAGSLLALGDETFLEDLKRAARNGSEAVRRAAMNALGNWQKPAAEPELRRGLKDRSPKVRFAAARQLARRKAGDAGVERELRAGLKRGGAQRSQALQALAAMGVDTTAEVERLAEAKRTDARKDSMASAHRLPKAKALALLRQGSRDKDAGVRLAAAGALAELAREHDEAASLLELMRKDSDPAVRARASIGLARAAKKRSAPDMGKVKPVKPAPLPKRAPAKKTTATTRSADEDKPLFVEDTSQLRSYKYHITQAGLATGGARYSVALRHLRQAARLQNHPPVLFELGYVHLKLAHANQHKQPRTARKHLNLAQRYFSQYLRRAPSGSQAERAKQGLGDVKRLSGNLKNGGR